MAMQKYEISEGPVLVTVPVPEGTTTEQAQQQITMRLVDSVQQFDATPADMQLVATLTPDAGRGEWSAILRTLEPEQGDPLAPGEYYGELIFAEAMNARQRVKEFILKIDNVLSY
jgi:hypothetical protein